MNPIGIEVPIECENRRYVQPFSGNNKRRIGEIHWCVDVLPHQRACSICILLRGFGEAIEAVLDLRSQLLLSLIP